MGENSIGARVLEYRGGKDEAVVTSRFEVVMVSETRWIRHGTYEAFFDDGQPRASGQFANGRMEGRWRFFHYDGCIAEEGEYTDSKRIGHWRIYARNGALERESEYLNGRRHGHTTNYYDNGHVKSEGEFEHGRPVGLWRIYEPDGTGYEGDAESGDDAEWD